MIDSKNNNDKKTSGAMWVDKNSFDLVEHEPENPDYIKVTPFEALEAAQKRIERLESVLEAYASLHDPIGNIARDALSQTSGQK